MLAQTVVPPYGGMTTPRSTLNAGIRSTKVTSVCQLLAAIPLVALRLSTLALPVLTVGWAAVVSPSSSAKAIWPASSSSCWSRKNTTLCSMIALRMTRAVSLVSSPPRRTPSTTAPRRPPTLVTESPVSGFCDVCAAGAGCEVVLRGKSMLVVMVVFLCFVE